MEFPISIFPFYIYSYDVEVIVDLVAMLLYAPIGPQPRLKRTAQHTHHVSNLQPRNRRRRSSACLSSRKRRSSNLPRVSDCFKRRSIHLARIRASIWRRCLPVLARRLQKINSSSNCFTACSSKQQRRSTASSSSSLHQQQQDNISTATATAAAAGGNPQEASKIGEQHQRHSTACNSSSIRTATTAASAPPRSPTRETGEIKHQHQRRSTACCTIVRRPKTKD